MSEDEVSPYEMLGFLKKCQAYLALSVLASPRLRFVFGRVALGYLQTSVLINTKPFVFLLLTQLGRGFDHVYYWHIFNILRSVPEHVFTDRWLELAAGCLDHVPGTSISEKIRMCDVVLLHTFGIWNEAGKAAKAQINFKKMKGFQ